MNNGENIKLTYIHISIFTITSKKIYLVLYTF